jgi:hypothetical protein
MSLNIGERVAYTDDFFFLDCLRNDLIGLIYYKLSSIIVRKRKRNIAYQSNVKKKKKTKANSNFYPLKGYFEGICSLESVSGKSISFKDE